MAYRGQLEAMKRRRQVLRIELSEARESLGEQEAELELREKAEAERSRRELTGKGGVALRWLRALVVDTATGAGVGVPVSFLLHAGMPGGHTAALAMGMSVGAFVGMVAGIRRAKEALL